jgi:sulfoxide reductase catalytic subunit YedY
VVAKGTPRGSLISEDPATLDTTHLELTPLDQFETMGLTDRVVDLGTWRLEVTGLVKRPLTLTFTQVSALPSIDREVLLICPGFFVNHGRWKGVSVRGILEEADYDRAASRVAIGAKGNKSADFPIADLLSGKVFLAYQVNESALPRKHGFPLRVVAEGYYGAEWVKYVDTIRVERS